MAFFIGGFGKLEQWFQHWDLETFVCAGVTKIIFVNIPFPKILDIAYSVQWELCQQQNYFFANNFLWLITFNAYRLVGIGVGEFRLLLDIGRGLRYLPQRSQVGMDRKLEKDNPKINQTFLQVVDQCLQKVINLWNNITVLLRLQLPLMFWLNLTFHLHIWNLEKNFNGLGFFWIRWTN